MTHVLVTGSSGTIGTALMNRLIDRGFEVTGVDRSPNRWSAVIQDHTVETDLSSADVSTRLPDDIDLIVHLAANARVHELTISPHKALDNVMSTFNVLEYARGCDADVIFASSREVYGNRGDMVRSETATSISESESPYAASKIAGEALVRSYENCYDIGVCVLRLSNVYGRYDRSDRVVPLFIARASRNRPLVIYGREKVLDFTYIEDCIDGFHAVIDQFDEIRGETFNIASGTGTSLSTLAEMIKTVMDSESPITVRSRRTGEVSRFIADISKATKLLGYKPAYDIQTGIRTTVEWYEDADLYDDILETDNRQGVNGGRH